MLKDLREAASKFGLGGDARETELGCSEHQAILLDLRPPQGIIVYGKPRGRSSA